MRTTSAFALVIFIFGSANHGLAQMNHTAHSRSTDHGTGSIADGGLLEPGQGAFAALSEVVTVLQADPDTDWAEVDLNGLRDHLVDMNRLVMNAVVTETALPNGIRAVATGDLQTRETLGRMVPAHAAELATDDRWTIEITETVDSVVLTATSEDPGVAERIKGLGFFGLMASQNHHREHHMLIARGKNAHRH